MNGAGQGGRLVGRRAEGNTQVINGIQQQDVSVVLQHDIKGFSVDAVEGIIKWGQAHGYKFLPLTPTSPPAHHPVNN